jgi:hypothetical protein
LLLRWHLLRLLFGVHSILALVALGSHCRLPLLGDRWVMASWRPYPVYMESLTSIPKRYSCLFSEEVCRFIFEYIWIHFVSKSS